MTKNKRFLFSVGFFSLSIVFFAQTLHAQQAAEQAQGEEAEPATAAQEAAAQTEEPEVPAPLSPEKQRAEMEIKTSTLPELAAWCRTLGLAENGTREELSSRLREHFELPDQISAESGEQKIITVNSAQTSEYFKIDVIDEEYARLRGDVSISLKDGDHIHTINAEEILFNRTRNTLTAKGGVEYKKTTETDGTVEIFRGENITVNIDTWAAVFLDGDSERTVDGDDATYIFSGTVISRTDEDTTILKDAVISNSSSDEPYWSITASKLWLLPGSDFAFANAVLKVGEIPLLWLPFFYYAADDVIFHPVFGYRSKEGGFIQTTTYILGRPKTNPEDQISITKILGSSNDMDKERQGIFLRSTGKKTVNPDEASLRLLLDHYVNMGTFTGLDLTLPKKSILSESVDFSIGFGFTRTVVLDGGNWTPYYPNYDGSFDWNHTNFFSYHVPFRYNFNFKSGISMKYGSVSWEFPYYSDPYVNRDFYDQRAESMDWFNIIQEGLSDTSSSASTLGAPQWKVHGNINPNVRTLSPYISNISISNISTSLTFKPLQDNRSANSNPYGTTGYVPLVSSYSPIKQFFAPDIYTIYNISASIAGSPFSYGVQDQRTAEKAPLEIDNPLQDIGEPVSPWERNNESGGRSESADIIAPPLLGQSFNLPRAGNLNFGIDYTISPTSFSELQFMSGHDHWKSADDVDWNDVQSVITSFSGATNVYFKINHTSGLFSNTITLSGLGSWRDFTYLNEDAPAYQTSGAPDPVKVEEARRQQYVHTRYSTSYAYNGTLRPFLGDPVFSQSDFQYDFKGTLVSSKRYDKDTSPDGPELTPIWGKLVKEDTDNDIYGLNSHKMSSNITALLFDKPQNLNFSTDLPPLDPSYWTNATFRIWYSETNINFRIRREAETATVKPGEWIRDPIYFTETLRFTENISFVYHMIIKPEENNDITDITVTLTLWNFRAEFTAKKTYKSEFIEDPPASNIWKWNDYGDEVLQPKELKLSYIKNFSERPIVNNILNYSFDISSSLTYDLIKHTHSNFDFKLTLNLKITNFMEIKLSTVSDNYVVFRYFKGMPGMDSLTFMYPDGRQNNVIYDLIDSFNFGDEAARRRSGFKMRGVELKATHFLGDWEAIFDLSMKPYLNETSAIPAYEVVTDFSFIVQWKPISEIKREIGYEGERNRWSSK